MTATLDYELIFDARCPNTGYWAIESDPAGRERITGNRHVRALIWPEQPGGWGREASWNRLLAFGMPERLVSLYLSRNGE